MYRREEVLTMPLCLRRWPEL